MNTRQMPTDQMRNAAAWVATSNGWGQYRWLRKNGQWFVQTDEGAFEGEKLLRIYEGAMTQHALKVYRWRRTQRLLSYALGAMLAVLLVLVGKLADIIQTPAEAIPAALAAGVVVGILRRRYR